MVQNSKAYTMRRLPRPSPTPRPPEAAGESISWYISSILVLLAYLHVLIYAAFLLTLIVLHFAFPT